jgi:hypothetical protein
LSPGESLDSELDRHGGGIIFDVASLLGASCRKTWLGGPRFSPLVFAVVQFDQQGRYAHLGWRAEDDIFSGPIKFHHLLFRWCIDKGGSFGVVALGGV